MITVVLILIVVSIVLAAIALFQSRAQNLVAWAVLVNDVAAILFLTR